jgi:hypothetical protein
MFHASDIDSKPLQCVPSLLPGVLHASRPRMAFVTQQLSLSLVLIWWHSTFSFMISGMCNVHVETLHHYFVHSF